MNLCSPQITIHFSSPEAKLISYKNGQNGRTIPEQQKIDYFDYRHDLELRDW